MLNTVTALLFSLLLLASPVRAEPVDDLLAALDNISQLQGNFLQRQYNQNDALESESSGHFRLLRPGYFAWEVTAPDSQLIIANSAYLWHFDRDLATVTRRPLADSQAMTPLQVLGGDDVALRQNYAVQRDAEGRFVLSPHTTDAGFRRLVLEIDGALIRGMEVLDNLNQRVAIDFQALDADSPLTAADFEFIPPPDADLFYHDE